MGQSRGQQHRHLAPNGLLTAFKHSHPMFRGFHQQDSQEFLKYFLDQMHEELMEPITVMDDDEVDDSHQCGVDISGGQLMVGYV